MPVYNGENFVAQALHAILNQSYKDFEVVISDNASTDGTRDICQSFAAKDNRIRYMRSDVNIGVEPNFNRAFELSRGRYFKWMAHDDLITPDFLEKCVRHLERDRATVLCHSLVRIIDENDVELGIYDSKLWHSRYGGPVARFASVTMARHLCTDMFGVMRRDALAGTGLLGDYHGSDRALLAELALTGEFAQVREPLFWNREHPQRSSRLAVRERRQKDDRTSNTTSALPTLALYRGYRRAIDVHVRDPETTLRCRRLLRKWWLIDWNFARLAVDIIARRFPSIVELVYALKLRFVGEMPQLNPPKPDSESPETNDGRRSVETPDHIATSR
jgi:glycosyltransferase involved in cell wall biosynthesis